MYKHWFPEFDLLNMRKNWLVKIELERLKLANEKQMCRLRNSRKRQ